MNQKMRSKREITLSIEPSYSVPYKSLLCFSIFLVRLALGDVVPARWLLARVSQAERRYITTARQANRRTGPLPEERFARVAPLCSNVLNLIKKLKIPCTGI